MRLLLFFLVVCIINSCSTAPEFERDGMYDPSSRGSNGIFIYPDANYNNLSSISYNSFIIKLNNGAVSNNSKIELISDVDGLFYTHNSPLSDTVFTSKTQLSLGRHSVDLVIDNKIRDNLPILVNRPNPVRFNKVKYNNGLYEISWEKYTSDDFRYYRLYSIVGDNKTLVKQFNSVNDTTYTDFDYPITEKYKYAIEVQSYKFATPSQQIDTLINPILFNYPIFFSNNGQHIALYSITQNKELQIVHFNDGQETTIPLNIDFTHVNFIEKENSQELMLSSNSEFFRIELNDEIDVDPTTNSRRITDFMYDKVNNLYFGFSNLGISTLNDELIETYFHYNFSLEFNVHAINTQKNILFSSIGLNPVSLQAHQYDSFGKIINSNINRAQRFPVSSPQSTISMKHNLVFISNSGHVFESDMDLERQFILPNFSGYITDYKIKSSNEDTVYISTSNGFLYKYDIPSETYHKEKITDYLIRHMLVIDDVLYFVVSNGLKSKILGLRY